MKPLHNSKPRCGAHACVAALLLSLGGCGLLPKGLADLDVSAKDRGIASWYGADFHGRLAADGRPFDMYALTAAHRSLPLGSVVRVLNVENGRFVVVRITDRGPYAPGRVLDLSFAAATRLGMVKQGLASVLLEVVAEAKLLDPWARNMYEMLLGGWPVVRGRSGTIEPERLPLDQSPYARQVRDVWGFPRQRRVADVLAANHHIDRRVAELLML